MPRFENAKTRRGVTQVRIAQTQSTHQSRGTDAYLGGSRVLNLRRKVIFESVSIIGDRPARIKRLTNCEKKENLSLHESDYYRCHHAPIIKFNIVQFVKSVTLVCHVDKKLCPALK